MFMEVDGDFLSFTRGEAAMILMQYGISSLAVLESTDEAIHFADDLRDALHNAKENNSEKVLVVNIPPSRLFLSRRLLRDARHIPEL